MVKLGEDVENLYSEPFLTLGVYIFNATSNVIGLYKQLFSA